MLLLALLVSLVSFQEVVQLCQECIAIDAVDHASFFNGLAAGRGAAQAVHADSEEQGCSLRCNIQHIANNSSLFNLNSHDDSLQFVFTDIL